MKGFFKLALPRRLTLCFRLFLLPLSKRKTPIFIHRHGGVYSSLVDTDFGIKDSEVVATATALRSGKEGESVQ